jgi:hypothetical protein
MTVHARPFLTAACLAAVVSVLAGCSEPYNCTVTYRGGCVAGPVAPPPVAPAPAPVPASQPVPDAANAPLGDPARFADVDDRQCRSYGLKFGTHDYADCRIRLSAQHRGLDPDAGTAAPARR